MEKKEIEKEEYINGLPINDEEKKEIAKKIKPILLEDALDDLQHLREIVENNFYDPRAKPKTKKEIKKPVNLAYCRIGNNFVDYFTYAERLNTRGKYEINFYEFLEQLDEFKKKKFIQTMFNYYTNVKNKNKTKSFLVVYKEIYHICISSIHLIRPIVLCNLFLHFDGKKPNHILDFNMGWGGAAAAAYACQIPFYTGIDMNINLRESYDAMISNIERNSGSSNQTKYSFHWSNALDINYKELPPYDFVFTSPPYFFIETYSHATTYQNKKEMIEKYYRPIFLKTWDALQCGGHYCLSINQEIYNVCVPILGEAHEKIALGRSHRGNPKESTESIVNYKEWIYVWKKQ